MLTIWGRANSINVQKVMWTVGELGLEHRRVDAGGPFGGLKTPEFLARNPNGLIPVIDDGGTVVWESHAIMRYLAAKYGSGSLWPEDAAARAVGDRWIEWTQTTLQPAFIGGVFWVAFRTPKAQQNPAAIARNVKRCGELMRMLDREVSGRPFLSGAEFALGDIPAGAQLFRYFELDIERPNLPHVESWYARLKSRPAYREHVMAPFEDLRGQI
jgi:glutathione S-transferase